MPDVKVLASYARSGRLSSVRARLALASLLLLPTSAGSCVGQAPPSLEDSRGVRVEWACSGRTCEVTGSSVPPPTCTALPDIDLFVLGAGAIAMLCGASVVGRTFELHEESCRPIVCADEGDCPQWDDRRYGCDAGTCTTTTRAPDMLDVTTACLATVDRPPTCVATGADPATQAALTNADGACSGSACTIPEVCRP